MELSLGLFFGNQGQIGQPLSEEISLLKCSSRSKQKILGLYSTRLRMKPCAIVESCATNFISRTSFGVYRRCEVRGV